MTDIEHDKKIKQVKRDIQKNIDRLQGKIDKVYTELDHAYQLYINGERSQWETLQECGSKMHELVTRKTELERKKKGLVTYAEKIKKLQYEPPDHFETYDGHPDIINIDHVRDIPEDYDGKMGVPITFLDSWNPLVYKILDLNYKGEAFHINGKKKYSRIVIQQRDPKEIFTDIIASE